MITTVTMNPAIDKIYLADDFKIHKLHRLQNKTDTITQPGGKGVNIAITLKRLGIDKVVAMGLAGGHTGRMLTEEIRKEGVTTNFIHVGDETRTDVSIIDGVNNTLTEINEVGKDVDEEDIEMFLDNYQKRLNDSKYVVIGGSMSPLIPRNFYGKLVELGHQKNVKTVVHCSPKLIEAAIAAEAFVLNPDMRSDHTLFGQPIDGIEQFIEVGKKIIEKAKKTEIVVFSHRIENVVFVTGEKSYILRPKNLKIVNMLGYGDAVVAGLTYALHVEMTLKEAVHFAYASGLTNVESIDKQTEHIEDIKKNMNRIDVEEIN